MRLRLIVGQPGNSSIISRVKLRQTTVQLCKRAGFNDVGHRLGLTTGAQISVCKTPCLSTGTAMRLTGTETVQERPLLSWEGESGMPDCGVVHQVGTDHWSKLPGFPPLTFDVEVMTHHKGFLDVRRCGGGLRISQWIGQRSCDRTFVTSLSMATFLWRAGGSMLARTGNQGSGVKHRVPEMSALCALLSFFIHNCSVLFCCYCLHE